MAYHCFTGLLSSLGACEVAACGGVAPGDVSACGGSADNEAESDGGVTTDCDWVSSMVLFNRECKINKILRQVYGISNAMPRLPSTTIPEALQALISMLILVSNLLIYMYQSRFSGFIKLPVSIII